MDDAALWSSEEHDRARRRAELLHEIGEMRALRDRLQPQRTRMARQRALHLRTLGRL